MKIGYPTHPRRDIAEEIRWIGRNGFDFADLFFEPDFGEAERIDIAAVSKALSEFRLGAVGHLAWYIPIGSPLPELRKASVEVARKYLGVFAKLGVNVVTIHAHWPPGLFSADEGIALQTECLLQIVATAKPLGISMVFEPVGDFKENLDNLRKLFALNPGLGFHLDIGHFNLHSRNPVDFAREFAHILRHVHMHDNDGQRDLHIPVGAGRIEWETLIPELKKVYDGTITLEVFTSHREYILLSREILRRLWSGEARQVS